MSKFETVATRKGIKRKRSPGGAENDRTAAPSQTEHDVHVVPRIQISASNAPGPSTSSASLAINAESVMPVCPSQNITEQDTTRNMTSIDKNRCAKCSMVVLEVFPMIMQDLMAQTRHPAKTLYKAIMGNAPFRKKLNKSELDMVDTLQTDEYKKIDVSLSYKIIVHFFQLFIPPPSRQWGANPNDTEIGIGEDIERIRLERNRFVHKVNANISETQFDDFFVTFIEVGKRIDAYLKKLEHNGYAQIVRQYKTCVLDPETEKKLLDALADIEQLKEKYICNVGIPGKEIHIFVGKSTDEAIEKIKAGGEDESYTKIKIYIHEVDDSEEVVKLINSLQEDLNSENITFKGAEKGSIILFIDVQNKVVLDDGLFESEVCTFIQKLFKFYNLAWCLHTQTYAVIASAAEEFEESTINLPEKTTGTYLMGDKGHVVLNFDVKNKIFHSSDSLHKTLNGVFNTLVMKGNKKKLLGIREVYAELVKSGNISTTEEDFTQAQTPVKYNLPVSVTLRKQLKNLRLSKDERPYLYDCIKISNTLLFADYINNRLFICNLDGTDIRPMPLSCGPWYMTEIDSNTVAVSCTNRKIIQIINISTFSITSTINTSGLCFGISYYKNNLYVVIHPSKLYVMDMTGEVIRSIPLPSDSITNITADSDRLVCIDNTSIYCCSLDGKLMWQFTNDKFQKLHRVTTDGERNVYVTDFCTNNVVAVSKDGANYREILTETDGLKRPWGIRFDKQENCLLVCNGFDGNAFFFDVKKKLA